MMDLKIFEPYFINNRTIIEYQQKCLPFSIRDILLEHARKSKNKGPYRLFFKVNQNQSHPKNAADVEERLGGFISM